MMALLNIDDPKYIIIFLGIFNVITADKVIKTDTGYVQGITVEGVSNNSKVEAYLGIPFAEPPLGRLRFEKPVPISPWNGVYDASHKAPPCVQYIEEKLYYTPDTENMTEDCLYLNLWVPQSHNASNHLKTIMIWIYGGGFILGSSDMEVFDGAALADFGDVIVASMNYRVGSFGFFSAFTAENNGNMGGYDMILATKWIKRNAVAFGGDPNQITLMGESAGAMCISAFIVSPITHGLFKRAILESGSAVLAFFMDNNQERHLQMSNKFAKLAGCADKHVSIETDPQIILKCLKRLTAEELLRAEVTMKKSKGWFFYPRSDEGIIPTNTTDLIRRGRSMGIEVLMGNNKDEGTLILPTLLPEYFGYYGHNRASSLGQRLLKGMMRLIFKVSGQTSIDEILDFYTKDLQDHSTDDYLIAFSNAIGDYLISCSTIFHADLHSIQYPVYFYKFMHRSKNSLVAEWIGTPHFDEVQYVFGYPLWLPQNYTDEEREISKRMMKRWVAFAKTGNPNIPGETFWPTYTYKNPIYLSIEVNESVHTRPDDYRCEFWRNRFDAIIDENLIQELAKNQSWQIALNLILLISMIMITLHLSYLKSSF